jgi:hypothetical protein
VVGKLGVGKDLLLGEGGFFYAYPTPHQQFAALALAFEAKETRKQFQLSPQIDLTKEHKNPLDHHLATLSRL